MKISFIKNLLIIIIALIAIKVYGIDKKPPVLEFTLEDNNTLATELTQQSDKIKRYLTDNSANDLDYLANEVRLTFKKFLHSLGYFSAKVDCNFYANVNTSQTNQNHIICNILPGNPYVLKDMAIKINPTSKDIQATIKVPSINDIKLQKNNIVVAQQILDAQAEIEKYIETNNCLFTLKTSHTLYIDKKNGNAVISYDIEHGQVAYIRNIHFTGLKRVKEDYALKLSGLTFPSCFQNSKLTSSKESLQQSGLFASVDAAIPDHPEKDGAVDINFNVVEQKPRTVKAGIKYTTDLGFALNSNLIHRNLFGEGEKIGSTITLSRPLILLNTYFDNEYFLQKNQKLHLENVIKKEIQEAYRNKEISFLGTFEKTFFKLLTLGGGVKYGINKVIDDNISRNYAFVSLPLFVVYDLRDNITDPTKGFLSKVEVTPYINTLKHKENFLKYRFANSCYLPLSEKNKTILALRLNFGTIDRAEAKNIPVNERFFAGGANSIRGYRYQVAGPLNQKRKPIGGRSILELSSELRFKMTEDIGFVTFIEGGNVYPEKLPKNYNKLFVAGGVGVRYYTSFGPIRADIAFPLQKRRRKVDSMFQLYFSIGQAF